MTINEYKESCINFAKAAKDWSALDPYRFYMASGNGEWYESCDAARGGISVAWVFEYRDLAAEDHITNTVYEGAYLNEYESAVQTAKDNDALTDEETVIWITETFADAVTLPDGTLTVMDENEWDAIVELMDEDILEILDAYDFYPTCTKGTYLSEYCKLHREKYGEEFTW